MSAELRPFIVVVQPPQTGDGETEGQELQDFHTERGKDGSEGTQSARP
ncbi:hypothetical protein R6G69_02035 [Actinotignum urinale]|nr:hypothetical protein [Actinotignum urinale]